MAKALKLAVFDCDGTLVDSQYAITACMSEAFEAVGKVAPPLAEVRRVVGLPLAEAVELLAGDPDAPVAEIVEGYSRAWLRLRQGGVLEEPLFEGVVALLDQLAAGDWMLGIATGKSRRGLIATLEKYQLEDRFVTLQTADIARGKPDPDMLLRAMAETGVAPADTVMIGDTTFDMEMAVAAKVRPIGVSWGYHGVDELRAAGAKFVAESMADIAKRIHFAEEIAS